jgi:hypothetical protein
MIAGKHDSLYRYKYLCPSPMGMPTTALLLFILLLCYKPSSTRMAPGCFSRLLGLTSAVFLSSSLLVSGLAAPRALSASSNSSDNPTVKLDYGTYQGYTSDAAVDYFLGMAYAQPPVGQLRFAKPLPPAPFEGVRNATAYSSMCAQQNTTTGLASDLTSMPGVNLSSTFVDLLSAFTSSSGEQSEDCMYSVS